MTMRSLPILMPRTSEQRYSCHGCAGCCRDFTVQLRPDDLARLEAQNWTERLGQSPIVEFRGRQWLRQREDGSCIFLESDGRCRIHAEFGLEAKPLACQMFPFMLSPGEKGLRIGLSFACPSMIHNRGAEIASHADDVRRMVRLMPEIAQGRVRPVQLNASLEASGEEEEQVVRTFERVLGRVDLPMSTRLDGAAWLTEMLAQAKLENVRGSRLRDLLDLLGDSFEEEIEAAPPQPPTKRQMKVLRQIVFAHVEDVKIGAAHRRGIGGLAIGQFWRHHTFGRGSGAVPPFARGWPEGLTFDMADRAGPATDDAHVSAVDAIWLRYLRSRIITGRAWGPGYYDWPIIEGLQAIWMMVAATGWLARLHAGAQGRTEVNLADLEAALLRTDRAAGRAPWLGSKGERLRLAWLTQGGGLRRLVHAMRFTDETSEEDDEADAGDSPEVLGR
ncbi:MAG: YkgJ family cysteine cluster protein [Phycisphaerales bacterium]|nr:YkgJ family cysteine cluster protein [Phycisphaerales bacterium]